MISSMEDKTKDCNKESDQFEVMIRDMGKKVQKFDTSMEEIMEKLQLSAAKMDEAEKDFKDKDEDVNAQNRRVLLLEEESRISVEKLATTVMKLAHMSKDADNIVKSCRHWESKTMNNEVEIEEIDINLREARRMASENEMKYDNLARSLAMMEDELKRADERVKNAEARVVVIEDELAAIGENQKALEVSEEKIVVRMHGEPARHFSAILRWKDLTETVEEVMGPTNPFTALVPRLAGKDPDDAFSVVPYEKGSTFLWYLEDLVGGAEVFEPFLKSY